MGGLVTVAETIFFCMVAVAAGLVVCGMSIILLVLMWFYLLGWQARRA